MKIIQHQLLYDKYKNMSDDNLKEIIDDDSNNKLSKEVAEEILNYRQKQNDIKQEKQRHEENIQTNPLYDDIHQIAKDISFIKSVIVIGIALTVILTFIGAIANNIN